LEAQGGTSLGPALATAIGMCQACPGSEIFVCTDGKSNVGRVGNMDSGAKVVDFYKEMGQYAKTRVRILCLVG